MVTDQASLTWLMTTKNPSGHLTRWSLLHQEFSISLRHRPGSRNSNSDALSRLPHDEAPYGEGQMLSFIAEDQRANIICFQKDNPFLRPIIRHLINSGESVPRKTRRSARAFCLENGVLFRRAKGFQEERPTLVVPRSLPT